MFSLTSLQESTHWEQNVKSVRAGLTADGSYSISCVTGDTDYIVVALTSNSRQKSRVVVLSRSRPEVSIEDATLLLSASPVLFAASQRDTALLVQGDGSLVVLGVREGIPQLLTCTNILSNPVNIVTNLCVCYAHDILLWTESTQRGGRYNSVLCSLNIAAIQQGEIGTSRVVCDSCPQIDISASGSVAVLIPKAKFFSGLIFLYSLSEKHFKIIDWAKVSSSNLQPWKNDLTLKYFMIHRSAIGIEDNTAVLASTPVGSSKNFYILDGNYDMWKLLIDERELLSKERLCTLEIPQLISGEALQMTSYQQLIITLTGAHIRVYELTQGVCIQSFEEPEGDLHLYSYSIHKYRKIGIRTHNNILLLENLPLRDQIAHLHASIPEDRRLRTLVRTPDLLQSWGSSSLQIKSALEAAYSIIKQTPNFVEDAHRDELESLFSQLDHDHIENPTILLNLFSKFPKFHTALQRELIRYQSSLRGLKHLRNNLVPFYCRGEFCRNISVYSSLTSQQGEVFTSAERTDVDSNNTVQMQVINYISSVVTESAVQTVCLGYPFIFEHLCLVSPEEVLESVKHFFSQDYKPNPNEKINWKKLFNSVEPMPSAIKDGREFMSSIFETVCSLTFQYDPEYLIPFITRCQQLLDVDCSKEPAFVRKSSHTQTYQRALDSLPGLSYLLSGNQELTTQKAIVYYKVLYNSKTLNSGNKCILILAAVSEWRIALSVLQQYTHNDYLHFYLFTTLSCLMNQAGVLPDFSEELYLMRATNFSVGEHLQMFNKLSKFHPTNPSSKEHNVAPFLKMLLREDTV